MSNYVVTGEEYLADAASYYGSIEQRIEEIALERGFRTRRGTVSINRLAELSGVSRSTLWYLLRDKRKFRAFNLVTLAKLCRALNAQPGDLLTYVPGGSAAGLGYSSDAFANLMGTRGRGSEYADASGSENNAPEAHSERGSLGDAEAVSATDGE